MSDYNNRIAAKHNRIILRCDYVFVTFCNVISDLNKSYQQFSVKKNGIGQNPEGFNISKSILSNANDFRLLAIKKLMHQNKSISVF